MREFAKLLTARLILEPLVADHARHVFEGLADPAVYRFIPRDPPRSPDELAARYAHLEARSSPDGTEAWLNWAVRLAGTTTYIGTVEATVRPDGVADMAYMIAPAHWRQGYAREACERLVAHLFAEWEVTCVALAIDTRNAASIALAESLGFRREAFVEGADYFKGHRSDEYHYVRAART